MSKGFNIADKIISIEEILYRTNAAKLKGFRVGFTNGCFDILHKGHVSYLENAKKHCTLLVVAVNSNESIKHLNKGDNRPINNENDRAFVIAGLLSVDFVIVFNDATPLSLIEKIKPDFLFKGGDYDANENDKTNKKYIVGSDIVRANGGKVITIPFVEGYSTTSILEKTSNI